MSLFCSFSQEKTQSGTRAFHDTCCSKPLAFHNGFICFAFRSCLMHVFLISSPTSFTHQGTHVFQIAFSREKMSKTVTPTCTCHLVHVRTFFSFFSLFLFRPSSRRLFSLLFLLLSSLFLCLLFLFLCLLSLSLSSFSLSLYLSRVMLRWCCVWCCVSCVCSKRHRVYVPHAPVCSVKTSPCVLAPRAHVSQHVRVVPVHTGDVLNVHTKAF